MSQQPNSQHLAWADRLFARFSGIWGAQKLGAMFPGETHDDVRALWASQLGRFAPESVGAALQTMTDAGREWPPSLSEFVAACNQAAIARQQHAPAALLDAPRPSPEVVAQQLAKVERIASAVKPMAGREWAHRLLARHAAGEAIALSLLVMARAAIGEEVAV